MLELLIAAAWPIIQLAALVAVGYALRTDRAAGATLFEQDPRSAGAEVTSLR